MRGSRSFHLSLLVAHSSLIFQDFRSLRQSFHLNLGLPQSSFMFSVELFIICLIFCSFPLDPFPSFRRYAILIPMSFPPRLQFPFLPSLRISCTPVTDANAKIMPISYLPLLAGQSQFFWHYVKVNRRNVPLFGANQETKNALILLAKSKCGGPTWMQQNAIDVLRFDVPLKLDRWISLPSWNSLAFWGWPCFFYVLCPSKTSQGLPVCHFYCSHPDLLTWLNKFQEVLHNPPRWHHPPQDGGTSLCVTTGSQDALAKVGSS